MTLKVWNIVLYLFKELLVIAMPKGILHYMYIRISKQKKKKKKKQQSFKRRHRFNKRLAHIKNMFNVFIKLNKK